MCAKLNSKTHLLSRFESVKKVWNKAPKQSYKQNLTSTSKNAYFRRVF